MALFTDGPLNTIEDLRAHDSQLVDVASTEGIDLTKKRAERPARREVSRAKSGGCQTRASAPNPKFAHTLRHIHRSRWRAFWRAASANTF